MRRKHLSAVVTGFIIVLFLARQGQGAIFCVDTEESFQAALQVAAHNQESDQIRIVADSAISPSNQPVYEIGFTLVVEGGYAPGCPNKPVFKEQPIPLATTFISPPHPENSTTGPEPPPESIPENSVQDGLIPAGGGQMRVIGVPGFTWFRGCGPTVAAMLLAYWDLNGMPDLFPGEARLQNNSINGLIASEDHYREYSEPRDDQTVTIKEDYSSDPQLEAHQDNSIADFMQTSWSADNMRYGWSLSTKIAPALEKYSLYRNPSYNVQVKQYYMMSDMEAAWSVLTNEIDHGRPMIFLVDSDGDSRTDHFVTVVGYRVEASRQYACLDTWDTAVHWHDFQPKSVNQIWGVWGGWSYDPGINASGNVGFGSEENASEEPGKTSPVIPAPPPPVPTNPHPEAVVSIVKALLLQ